MVIRLGTYSMLICLMTVDSRKNFHREAICDLDVTMVQDFQGLPYISRFSYQLLLRTSSGLR
jgi:hypothetical protein